MPHFRLNSLSKETKKLHESQESQNGWRKKNWKKMLEHHNQEIEKCIEKINLFDIWLNELRDIPEAKKLSPEIFMDAYISIHFAGYGLYKYAYMCLRSELETALRLVYFSRHEVEFEWWSNDEDWYRRELNQSDVWPGKGYTYFKHLREVKNFEKLCGGNKKLFTNVSNTYKDLSKFIHSGAEHLQTRADRISPKYELAEFRKWKKTYTNVQSYIHIILSLGFSKKFKNMQSTKRNKILDGGMSSYYKDMVKQVLGL